MSIIYFTRMFSFLTQEFIMREDIEDYVTARSSLSSTSSFLEAPPNPH